MEQRGAGQFEFGPPPAPEPEPVHFDARLVAAIIDGVWLLTLAMLLSPWLDKLKRPAGAGGMGMDADDVNYVLALVLWMLYSATEVLTAGTLGKRLLDVRVARRDARPSTLRRRAARWAVKGAPLTLLALPSAVQIIWKYLPAGGARTGPAGAADVVTLLLHASYALAAPAAAVVAVGALWALAPGARALHDRIAGTAVFRDADVGRAESPRRGFMPLLRALPLRARPVPTAPGRAHPPSVPATMPSPSIDKDVIR